MLIILGYLVLRSRRMSTISLVFLGKKGNRKRKKKKKKKRKKRIDLRSILTKSNNKRFSSDPLVTPTFSAILSRSIQAHRFISGLFFGDNSFCCVLLLLLFSSLFCSVVRRGYCITGLPFHQVCTYQSLLLRLLSFMTSCGEGARGWTKRKEERIEHIRLGCVMT